MRNARDVYDAHKKLGITHTTWNKGGIYPLERLGVFEETPSIKYPKPKQVADSDTKWAKLIAIV